MNETLLNNPVWHSLGGAHAQLGRSNALARRYRQEVTPIGAVAEPTDAAYAALAQLTELGDVLYLGTSENPPLPACWVLEVEKPMLQMHLTKPAQTPAPVEFRELGPADSARMVALAELTHPGPFGPEAWRMGRYIGVFEQDKLVAMAGQRFTLPGLREISAVCTHPDWQGRGLARALMNHLAAQIQRDQNMPFLHVVEENQRASGLYERMGFVTARRLWVRVIRRVR